jgi:hypothetical protein
MCLWMERYAMQKGGVRFEAFEAGTFSTMKHVE